MELFFERQKSQEQFKKEVLMHAWRERYDGGLCLLYWLQLMGMKLKCNSYEIAEIKWYMDRAIVYFSTIL